MTAVSTIPALKAGLKARLEEDPDLAGVHVSRCDPYPTRPAAELVVIGGAVTADESREGRGGQSTASFGQMRREERYVVEVLVSLEAPAHTQGEVLEDRAYEIASVVATSIRTWKNTTPAAFDGLVRWALVTGCGDDEERFSEDGKRREYRVTLRVSCAERL